jgi:hypothetical protein
MPTLTSDGYRRLRFLSSQLHTRGKDTDVVDLADRIQKQHGDVVKALQERGVSRHDAGKLLDEALSPGTLIP